MRDQVLSAVHSLYRQHPIYTLLGDLGVFQCRQIFEEFPDRIINFGIMEQSMVGVASGLSGSGMYPVLYSITPFLVDRAFEQIKLDLVYNQNPALVISAGSSYDYSKLGPTHFCPHDISVLNSIGFPLFLVPNNPSSAVSLATRSVEKKQLAYLRLSTTYLEPEIDFPSHRQSTSIACDKSSFTLYKHVDEVCAVSLLFGPDSKLMPQFHHQSKQSDLIIITSFSLPLHHSLVTLIREYSTINIFLPFEPGSLLASIMAALENSNCSLNIYSIANTYEDRSSTKESIFKRYACESRISLSRP